MGKKRDKAEAARLVDATCVLCARHIPQGKARLVSSDVLCRKCAKKVRAKGFPT